MPFTTSQTCVCLMVNLVSLNLTLFLTVHFHAVHGYGTTHMRTPHVHASSSILPPSCGCIMLLISTIPTLNSIARFDINMYILYAVYKDQGIDWQLQSDSLGVSFSKVDSFNSPIFISGLPFLVNDLRHWFALLDCFITKTMPSFPMRASSLLSYSIANKLRCMTLSILQLSMMTTITINMDLCFSLKVNWEEGKPF